MEFMKVGKMRLLALIAVRVFLEAVIRYVIITRAKFTNVPDLLLDLV